MESLLEVSNELIPIICEEFSLYNTELRSEADIFQKELNRISPLLIDDQIYRDSLNKSELHASSNIENLKNLICKHSQTFLDFIEMQTDGVDSRIRNFDILSTVNLIHLQHDR